MGRRLRWTLLDLYEQCSLHMALTTPSSQSDGVRPSEVTRRSYSSGFMPISLARLTSIFSLLMGCLGVIDLPVSMIIDREAQGANLLPEIVISETSPRCLVACDVWPLTLACSGQGE